MTASENNHYSPEQRALSNELEAIIAPHLGNVPGMATAMKAAGFVRDSIGQIFRDGLLVPPPAHTGVMGWNAALGRMEEARFNWDFAKQVLSTGPATVPAPEPELAKPAGKTR